MVFKILIHQTALQKASSSSSAWSVSLALSAYQRASVAILDLISVISFISLTHSFTESLTKQLFRQPHQAASSQASPSGFSDSLTKRHHHKLHQTALRTASPRGFITSFTKQLYRQPHQHLLNLDQIHQPHQYDQFH